VRGASRFWLHVPISAASQPSTLLLFRSQGSQCCGTALCDEGGTVAFQVGTPFPDAPQSSLSWLSGEPTDLFQLMTANTTNTNPYIRSTTGVVACVCMTIIVKY